MPRPAKYVPPDDGRPVLQDPLVSQRNPFEMYLLSVAALAGVLSLLGYETSGALDAEVSDEVRRAWATMLVTGCASALLGGSRIMRAHRVDLGLRIERFGLQVAASGVAVYGMLLLERSGINGFYGFALNMAFALSCVVRAHQISKRFRWWDQHRGLPSSQGRPR